MTLRNNISWRSSATAVGLLLAATAILWSAFGGRATPTAAKPAEPELAPQPRVVEPVAYYADLEPAKNPARLCLQDDGNKVVGWFSGPESFAGMGVLVQVGDKTEWVKIRAGNIFTWDYTQTKPTDVTVSALFGWQPNEFFHEKLTIAPAVAEKDPSVFFVVDRTAYRPTQVLNFAGFLRRLNGQGEFEPIPMTDVNVELVSQQKQTKIYKAQLKSDESGKIAGSYVFSDADPLDTYTLRIPAFKGEAKLLLGEYRKSKIRLKISGDVKDEKLTLKFETVDFLDKAVPATKLSFNAQVVEKKKEERTHALKAEDFAYFTPSTNSYFETVDLAEEDRLLWIADNVMPQQGSGNGSHVVAQFNNDMALNGAEPGQFTIDLKKEWKVGHFSIAIQGVVTDANGREQRASHSISLACVTAAAKARLEIAKEIYAAGEKIVTHLKSEDGRPVDGVTSLIVMKLSPAPVGGGGYGYGYYGDNGYYGLNQYAYSYRNPRRYWNYNPPQEAAKRTLVTALPLRDNSATVKITEPGAYKLVAVTHHDDGRTTQTEAGCIVKNGNDLTPFSMHLDRDSFNSGDRLQGTIYSRYTGAKVLLTLRDSSGLRFWKPMTLNDKGVATIDESLPAELKYGCSVDLHYLDDAGINFVLGRFIRVNPKDRILTVTTQVKEEVIPGEQVKIALAVDRPEQVDLIVSVYDQSLLGINPDKSVDIRNFYLADERARVQQASDLLRRRLGDVTIETLVMKAEALIKADPRPGDPAQEQLKAIVSNVRSNKYLRSNDLVGLLRLAGLEIQLNPFWYAYHGQSWHYPVQDVKAPLRQVVLAKHGEYYLVFGSIGETLMLHEMHPSWVNINPMQYANRYYNRLGYASNLGYGRNSMEMGNMARGDAHRSFTSGNSSNSFRPEAQGFISHMPAPNQPGGGQPVPLIDADADQGHIGVRRDFSDSAYWNAHVRTDKDGRAEVEFKVPDSLTNWQVVVTAVSKKMHVGQAKAAFRTFKPIMVWPMLPRTFTEGDLVELFGSVHNRTDKAQDIKVRLKVENGEILTAETKTVHVPAKDSVNVYWTFRARSAGFTQLLMSVDCEGGSDASLKRLPVLRAAAEQILTKSGQVKGDGTTFVIPKDIDLNSARLEVSFAPSLAADLADTLNFLVDYPYGCVEQTMSRFLPAVKVAQILKQYQVDHPELNKKMPGVVASGVKRLLELQQPDGGWGWHGGSQTHEMMTPYALFGLLQAEKGGYTIPNETAIQRGLVRLRNFIDIMNEQQASDRIYCMYVYSHREKLTDDMWKFIDNLQKQNKLTDYATALCLEMAVEQEKKDLAKKLMDGLRSTAKKNTNGHVYWTTAGFSRWSENPHEITAAAMKAIVAFDKDDALIDGILGYFAATKRGDRWNSTKDTAMILFAMCDYLAKANYNPEAKNELAFTLNGDQKHDVKFDDKLTKKITIPGGNLKAGDNKLTFKTEMTGVMYRAVLRYWKTGRDIAAMDKGIKVERKFMLWDEKTKQITKTLKSGDTVDRGAYIICDTMATYHLPEGMRYMLMECPKPATAEVIPMDDPRFAVMQVSTGYALREERLASVAFHHEQTGQIVQNRVIMLAELAGDYVVAPAFVELMYQTETRGHSGSFSLKVADVKK